MEYNARLHIDLGRVLGVRDRKLFGFFIEHFHRQVYGGIFDPGAPLADEHGFRRDVLDALKKIRVPVIRWPGGCFASAYHWKDGVGQRIPVFDKAWRVEEPNTFGCDEFIQFCRLAGAEPYLCTNAGSGSAEEMSDWVEYCNLPKGGKWASLRAANGHPQPHNVRYWGIGNENYADWEIGAKRVDEWGRFVAEAAKMMKRVDGSIRLGAASIPDYGWNTRLLQEAGRYLDWISIHGYWADGSTPSEVCLARSSMPEKVILQTEQLLGALGLSGRVKIFFDEWNLRSWHHPSFDSPDPNLTERDQNDDNSVYTLADALFAARFLNACLRHCQTVEMANFSPAVNARGAIFTHNNGLVLRPPYHVFDLYANHTASEVLGAYLETPAFNVSETNGSSVPLPCLDASVTLDRPTATLHIAAVNLHPDQDIHCQILLSGGENQLHANARILTAESVEAYNDVAHPDRVQISEQPQLRLAQNSEFTFPAHSLTILTLRLS